MKSNIADFLEIKNATDKELDLYFYGDIVDDPWETYDDEIIQYPQAIKDFLVRAKGRALNIHINSGGGSVFAGIAIYNMIKNYPGKTTTYIEGLAGSIASVIALASDKVIMRTGSVFMIHKPLVGIQGYYNADRLLEMAVTLDAIQEAIMEVYKENLAPGANIQEVERMVNEETWLTSNEAVQYFNMEVEKLSAVACTSEYLEKYAPIPLDVTRKAEILKAQLELQEIIKKGEAKING